MKKQLLFVYDNMMIGGTTTSLLSIMNIIDYTKYNVDLLLYTNDGPFFNEIPVQVNVLKQAYASSNNKIFNSKNNKIILSLFNGTFIKALYYALAYNKYTLKSFRVLLAQLSVAAQITLSRSIEKQYDTAIGFMENWSDEFVASKKVRATKEIAWIHPDYKDSYLIPDMDREMLGIFDNIVLVSNKCYENFCLYFPEHANRAKHIENIILKKVIFNKSLSETPEVLVDKKSINIVTVCRIDYSSKGIDRGLNAFIKLKSNGYLNNTKWYIIGDGQDYKKTVDFIEENDLNDCIFMLGSKLNPLPYVKLMDCFFLPSRYEGKPIAVTEALMLGLPCIVTEYASAREQILHNKTGIILNNSEDGVYFGLKQLINNNSILDNLKASVKEIDYSNQGEIEKLYKLL